MSDWKIRYLGSKDGDGIMKKIKNAVVMLALTAVIFSGCGEKDYDYIVENHKAVKMMNDGIWSERYESKEFIIATDDMIEHISINVHSDISEDEMMEIIDYYEFQAIADFDENMNYLGRKDGDCTCYAVFFEENTDKEIKRLKTINGEIVEITEEDKYSFPSADTINQYYL